MSREHEPNEILVTYRCGKGHTTTVARTASYEQGYLPPLDICPEKNCTAQAIIQKIDFQ